MPEDGILHSHRRENKFLQRISMFLSATVIHLGAKYPLKLLCNTDTEAF
jgi:hypothetical protein